MFALDDRIPSDVPGSGQFASGKTILDKTPQHSFGHRPDIEKPSDVSGNSELFELLEKH